MADATTTSAWQPVAEAVLSVIPPYRLNLTVTRLQRTPRNLVDILTADGCYPWGETRRRNPGEPCSIAGGAGTQTQFYAAASAFYSARDQSARLYS